MLQRRLAPNLPRGFDDDLQLAFLVILIDQVTHHVRGKAALGTDRELFERHILRGFVDPRGAAWIIYPTVEGSWLYLIAVGRLGTFWAALTAVILAIGIGVWMARRHAAVRAVFRAVAEPSPT